MLTVNRFNKMVEIARNLDIPAWDDLVFRHVAFIFKKGKIHTVGWNSNKSHPMADTWANTHHAEFDAANKYVRMHDDLRKYDAKALSGLDVLVIRLSSNYDKTLRMSKPCPSCEKYLVDLGARNIYYSYDETRFYRLGG